jgi:hypothetical protein
MLKVAMIFVKTCLQLSCVLLFCLCFDDSIPDEETVYGNHSVLVVLSDVSTSSSAITNRQRSCLMDAAECTVVFECVASLFRSETCHSAHEPLHASVHQTLHVSVALSLSIDHPCSIQPACQGVCSHQHIAVP